MPESTTKKTSTFLLFPWGLLSIVLILALNLALSDSWFRDNWSWITLTPWCVSSRTSNFKTAPHFLLSTATPILAGAWGHAPWRPRNQSHICCKCAGVINTIHFP
jgi:hypothetical protein